jgi:hypothetical protein
MWGPGEPQDVDPGAAQGIELGLRPGLFSKTKQDASGAKVNFGQGLDQLEMEEGLKAICRRHTLRQPFHLPIEQGQGWPPRGRSGTPR